MKANELRINNWYLLDGKECQIIITLDFQEFLRSDPIPLTEEWLKRFGFEWSEVDDDVKGWGRNGHDFHIEQNHCSFEVFWYEQAPCEYVHQLQNLYFALTGEELELKEK